MHIASLYLDTFVTVLPTLAVFCLFIWGCLVTRKVDLVFFLLQLPDYALTFPLIVFYCFADAVVMFSILAKHLHAAFIVPVLLYCFTIASMVYRGLARSSAVFPLPSVQFSLIGCLFFLLSDSTLAINMFMSSFSAADQLVMSTYYVAQCCMGLSAATFVQGWPGLCTSSERTVGFFRCPARTEAAVAGAGQHDSLADDSKHLLVNEAASASSV